MSNHKRYVTAKNSTGNIMKSNITPKREHYTVIHVNNWGPIFTWKVVDLTYGLDSYEAARSFVDQYFGTNICFDIRGDVMEVIMSRTAGYYEDCSPGSGSSRKKKDRKEYFLLWEGKFEKKPFFQGLKDSITQYKKVSFYKPKLWFNKV